MSCAGSLAISIAGQLVKELQLDSSSDWDGVLAELKEEFDAGGGQRSVEECGAYAALPDLL